MRYSYAKKMDKVGNALVKAKTVVVDKAKDIKAEDVIQQAMKLPIIKVNREKFYIRS